MIGCTCACGPQRRNPSKRLETNGANGNILGGTTSEGFLGSRSLTLGRIRGAHFRVTDDGSMLASYPVSLRGVRRFLSKRQNNCFSVQYILYSTQQLICVQMTLVPVTDHLQRLGRAHIDLASYPVSLRGVRRFRLRRIPLAPLP